MSDADTSRGDRADARPGTASDERDALVSRLRLIEDQPLDQRAEALGRIHDELRAVLESGDAPVGD